MSAFDDAPDAAKMAIWAACRRELPAVSIDALACVSRTAVHYGIGGEIHDASMKTIGLRSGLRLGVIKPIDPLDDGSVA